MTWLVNVADQFPGAQCGSTGLKGVVSSVTGPINAGASGLCFLLPAEVGIKSSLHRDKKTQLHTLLKGTTGEALQERMRGCVETGGGGRLFLLQFLCSTFLKGRSCLKFL